MSPDVVRSIAELRDRLAGQRKQGSTIGLVPTMGALHAGHARLIEQAVRECDCVVVSIFVNPIQFDRQDDYDLYPRTLSADAAFCQARGARFVFAPPAEEMYPAPQRTFVEVTRLSDHLCGRFRPGHFRGVATVVLKLLSIVQPARTYFGEKDAQQLAVIRRMVADLNLPVTIVAVSTVRESDGLAVSSRNQRLSPEDRRVAPVLHRALRVAEGEIASGTRRADEIKAKALEVFRQHPEVRVEYLEIVDEDMQPVDHVEGPVRVAGAIWLGSIRLIDNLRCHCLPNV